MVSTSLANVDVLQVGRETTVRCRVRTVPGCTARSMDAVSTDDVSVMPDSLGSTASTVTG